MELSQVKNFIKQHLLSFKGIIAIGVIGVWIIVFQNLGIIPISQNVRVTDGNVDAYVSGYVSVDNTVDVNLQEINGYKNCFYGDYDKHPNEYYKIPVAVY